MVSNVAELDAGGVTCDSTRARQRGSSAQDTSARIQLIARAASCSTSTPCTSATSESLYESVMEVSTRYALKLESDANCHERDVSEDAALHNAEICQCFSCA